LIVEYRKKFLKELSKIPSKTRKNIEHFVFEELQSYTAINESAKIEKLKGYRNYYKVRFGDYRIGLQIKRNKIICERVLHRREIYRRFP